MRPMTGSDALVAQLEALGVEVVFGIPGVHNLAAFESLRLSTIRTVVVRHEQSAGYAADGYARATGNLGVCLTTTGPGAANTAAAMGEARAARVPVLHISTQIPSRLLAGRSGRFSLHESPHQQELMRAVCVWSERVARAEAIPALVTRAARAAFAGRRGPAFLEVPYDFLDAPVRSRIEEGIRLTEPVPPDPAGIEKAARLLRRATRPLIWAGGGAVASGAGPALAAVAETLDAPVVTTFAGKGILPPSHPLCVGFPPHQPQVTRLIAGADALLAVGTDFDAMTTQAWRLPLPRRRVAINVVAADARRNYPCDVVEADARLALEALAERLPATAGRGAVRRVRDVRAAAVRSLRASAEFRAPFAFVERLAGAVPDDAAVFADMAVPGYWAAGYYPSPRVRSLAYPLGWGTLGYAFPAALGAAAAGRKTVVVCGDGGLLFAPGEFATAVQERLPVVVVVVNDGGYGMLRFDQAERFGHAFGVDLVTPDFVALARSFGVKARRAKPAELAAAIKWALGRRGPALVEVAARWAPPVTTSPRWPLRGRPEARRSRQ